MGEKFHERFDLPVNFEEARRAFLLRVSNLIFHRYIGEHYDYLRRPDIVNFVASRVGQAYTGEYLEDLAGSGDFYAHLKAVEALYEYPSFVQIPGRVLAQKALSERVDYILNELTEVDIGIRWETGHFYPKGAALLDEKLVNEPLRWLRETGHTTVAAPLEKALDHLLRSQAKPELLTDVVTDAYEALEALAKIMTARDKDLSANAEGFIAKVKASDAYKTLLKDYIEYANKFRHAAKEGRPKPALSASEVESFVYLTGVFIRLAIS